MPLWKDDSNCAFGVGRAEGGDMGVSPEDLTDSVGKSAALGGKIL